MAKALADSRGPDVQEVKTVAGSRPAARVRDIDDLALLRSILNAETSSLYFCDHRYVIREVNAIMAERMGVPRDQIIGREIREVLGPLIFQLRKPCLDKALAGEHNRVLEWGVRLESHGKLLDISHSPVRGPEGEIVGVAVRHDDVTKIHNMREQLGIHEEVLRQTSDRIAVIGTDYRCLLTNRENARHHGVEPEDLIGQHVADLTGADRFYGRIKAHYDRCFAGEVVEYEIDHPDREGRTRWLRVRMDPYRDRCGVIMGCVVTVRDITQATLMLQKIKRQVLEDALTGLANRYALQEQLERRIERCREAGCEAALIAIDLDGFKIVNDLVGHSAGDELLRRVAAMLRTLDREHSTLSARVGGDEFAVLIDISAVAEALTIARRIVANLAAMRFEWSGMPFAIGGSVGVALLNNTVVESADPSVYDVLNWADQACLLAKEAGGSRVILYEPGTAEAQARLDDIGNLRLLQLALDTNSLCLYTMPIAPIAANQSPYSEVLLRIPGRDGRVLAPGPMIASAERHGLMGRIDRWVVTSVIEAASRCRPELRLSVNLSGQSVGDPEFKAFLIDLLDRNPDIAPRLAFEITETATVRSMATAQALTAALRQRGAAVILDDFGAGLSSFAYLRQFEIDSLKIDGAIIGNVVHDEVQRTIVAGIVAIAEKLGVGVIAEYVGDQQTLDVLRELGVTHAQGYHIGEPKPWHCITGCPAISP